MVGQQKSSSPVQAVGCKVDGTLYKGALSVLKQVASLMCNLSPLKLVWSEPECMGSVQVEVQEVQEWQLLKCGKQKASKILR